MNNKDLIKQYVNTGLKLPKYQVDKLSNNDFNSYIRLRMISIKNDNGYPLEHYEYYRMNDEMKNYLVKSFTTDKLYDGILNLNGRANNDDFIKRVINLRPLSDIKEYFNNIVRESHSRSQTINELLSKFGYVFNERREFSVMLTFLDSDEHKFQFSSNYLKGLNKSLGDEKMTSLNSPIESILYHMNNGYVTSIVKLFITLNYKKPDGKTMDDNTFFAMLNDTSDSNFNDIVNFMQRYLELTPNQLQFIKDEQRPL